MVLTGEVSAQWQTIYCSLMLLLCVFFVMLIAYSVIDADRFMHVKKITTVPSVVERSAPDMNAAMQSLIQLTTDGTKNEPLSIEKTTDGFKAVIPNPVLFNSGDASLNDSITPVLDNIVTVVKRNPLTIQIEGHTDNIPINTAAFPSNWELSTMRAVNILRYFHTIGGIASDRLVAVGFAEYQPVSNNDTPEGRKTNRRIEIVFRPVK
jgi:chemotaxis protein MotB